MPHSVEPAPAVPEMLGYRSPTDEERPVTAGEVLKAAVAICLCVLSLVGSCALLFMTLYILFDPQGDRDRVARVSVAAVSTALAAFGAFASYRTTADYLGRRNRRRAQGVHT